MTTATPTQLADQARFNRLVPEMRVLADYTARRMQGYGIAAYRHTAVARARATVEGQLPYFVDPEFKHRVESILESAETATLAPRRRRVNHAAQEA